MAEMFLLGWAGLMTALWQLKVREHRYFMRKTAEVIEDVINGKAKFVVADNGDNKTFTIEKVQ
jgi:hypothetical protein